MRWTADAFWRDRADVAPTRMFTQNDALRTAFLAGATEAEVLPATPDLGDATVRVAGCGWRRRRQIKRELEDEAPIGTRVFVEKLKGRDDGEES